MIKFFKENKIKFIISTVITLLPIIIGLLLWNKLPETVPIHWNAQGEIDGYAPKLFAVITLPIIMAVLNLVCIFAIHTDNKNRGQNKKLLNLSYFICPIISIIISGIIYYTAFGLSLNAIKVIPILLGVLFLFIGNYMPKCRYNHTVGIRIPTTLKSEENWDKTHYFAGKVWVMGSIFIILTALLPESIMFYVSMPIVLVMAFLPMIYSVIISKK